MRGPRLLFFAAWLVACGGGADIPLPDLSRAEPEVVEAVEQARAEVTAHPGDASAWGRLGERYLDLEWSAEAARCFERAAALDPRTFRWPYLLALAVRLDEPARAAAALERALALDETYAPAHVHAGFLALRLGRRDEARRHFERAIELAPNLPHPHFGLAQLAMDAHRYEDAREHLERALARAPDYREAHLLFSRVLFALGDRDAAQRHAALARRAPPNVALPDPRAKSELEPVGSGPRLLRAQHLFARGRLEEARAQLERALEMNPRLDTAHVMLARIALRAQDVPQAEAHLERALELNPANTEALGLRGLLLERLGRHAEAVESLERALERDPHRAPWLESLGRALAASGRLEDALQAFARAAKADPERPDPWEALGRTAAHLGRWDQAEEGFREALERRRRRYREALRRATAGLRAENREAADRAARASAAEVEGQARIHAWLGRLRTERGDLAGGRAELEQALRLDPDGPFALAWLARNRMAAGAWEEAAARLERAAATHPGDPEVLLARAWFLAAHPDRHRRDAARAAGLARQAADALGADDPRTLDALAAALTAAGKRDEALAAARRALERAEALSAHRDAATIRAHLREYERGRVPAPRR